MAKESKNAVKMWRAAVSLAGDCLVGDSGLPEKGEVTAVACALLAAGLVTGGKAGRAIDRAGQDSDQDEMLSDAYDTGSSVGR